jgi:DNA-binding MarR family transcriptional regulator
MKTPTDEAAARRQRFDSEEQEAFLNLWRTYDLLRALEDELFSRHELTAQQYNALRLLRAAHPERVPTLELAGQLVSRAPDITRLVDRLHDRGLVVRERSPDDRRAVHLGITDAGVELLNRLAAEVRACHLRQLGHLAGDDLLELTRLLKSARAPHEPDASKWR